MNHTLIVMIISSGVTLLTICVIRLTWYYIPKGNHRRLQKIKEKAGMQ